SVRDIALMVFATNVLREDCIFINVVQGICQSRPRINVTRPPLLLLPLDDVQHRRSRNPSYRPAIHLPPASPLRLRSHRPTPRYRPPPLPPSPTPPTPSTPSIHLPQPPHPCSPLPQSTFSPAPTPASTLSTAAPPRST